MPTDQQDVSQQLEFTRGLQAVANRIHATSNLDEIMLEIGQSICELFHADRLTIYAVGDQPGVIVSKIKTGLNSFKDLKLPVNEQSIAGYVGLHRKRVNIADVYDEAELLRHSASLHFLKAVDEKTGYRTRQMLVAPIVDESSRQLVGVVQLINHKPGGPFPPLAEEGVSELCKTLAIAMKLRLQGQPFAVRTKYDHLIATGVISAAEMELAQRAARRKQLDLEVVLQQEFQVSSQAIGDALAQFFGVPYQPFVADWVKPQELLKNLKREFLENQQWLPLEENAAGVVILTPDPERVCGGRLAAQLFPRHKVEYRVCSHKDFSLTLDLFFGSVEQSTSIGEMLAGLDEADDSADEGYAGDDLSAAQDNELVKLVNKIIVDAYNLGASDIHIEPYPGKQKTLIRFRRDGSLMNYIEIPSSYRTSLVARIKIMCDLDISERRKPQDGKIKFKKFGPLDIELRVATVPTQGGLEDVVMRILAAGEPLPLEKLALSKRNLGNLKSVVSKPYGLFFVCGPTGSGKTTTLHSVLKYLNTPETKIWTAEDPVEITQNGLRQVQMNPKAGLTFATAMKAFLRADPDVIMVGEMRDKETTATGIEASLTGHLVLATLHTNSAPESIIRLLDMGMDPFNFADALLGVLAQRLAKRLCGKCRQAYHPDAAEVQGLLDEYAEELAATSGWRADPEAARKALREEWLQDFADKEGRFTLYRAVGCEQCAKTGYKGRVGLHELLVGSDEIKKKIQEHARVAELFAVALDQGMRTLKQDGIEKVLQGITDMQQVRAVCIK